ncbi:hypothetical protein GCM10010201_05510 [Pilimelia columellifera subsp. columellifera]|uniref:DUF1616 domain-containing protein n=1 Tax=Pilimelia columellifera subsp. columellifera TaxID=706583 RepID=A0ABP6AD43_9ACTN
MAALVLCALYAVGVVARLPLVQVPSGLALAGFVPGWLALRVAGVGGPAGRRAALAVAGSLCLSMALPLLAELFDVPASRGWTVGALCLVTGTLAVIDLIRCRRGAPGRPATPGQPGRASAPTVAAVAGVVAAVVLGASALAVAVHSERRADAAVITQVGLTPTPGASRTVELSLTNREGRPVSYVVVVELPGSQPASDYVTVPAGRSWTRTLTADRAGTVRARISGGAAGRYEVSAVLL